MFFNMVAAETADWVGNLTYQEFVDLVRTRINPELWSHDFYPIQITRNTKEKYLRPEFYKYLTVYHNLLAQTGKPFWAFSMCTPHYDYPTPTKSDLTFEAFSALAYGAKGIVYYSYSLTYGLVHEHEYKSAPVNEKGEITSIWSIVKSVNAEINKYSELFAKSEVAHVGHIGVIPVGAEGISFPLGCVESVGFANPLKSSGCLVSCMRVLNRDQGGNPRPTIVSLLVLVNQSPFREIDIKVKIKDLNSWTINAVTPNIQDGKYDKHEKIEYECNLAAGGYAIFQIVSKIGALISPFE